MGWGSGAQVADDVWAAIKGQILVSDRSRVAKAIVDVFENNDADTIRDGTDIWEATGIKSCPHCGEEL